jgi:hypothetical protein
VGEVDAARRWSFDRLATEYALDGKVTENYVIALYPAQRETPIDK